VAFSYKTVTHTFETAGDLPATGTVEFCPIDQMRNGATTIAAAPESATLDVTGSISKLLAATSDAGTTPPGVTYRVTERIVGQPIRIYYVSVPQTVGSPVDLHALPAGLTTVSGGVVALRSAADYDDSIAPADGQVITWDGGTGKFHPEAVPPGGGAVSSVNGQTGAVSLTASGLGAQPVDSDLTGIAALAPVDGSFLGRQAGAWADRSAAQTKTDLALDQVDNTSDVDKPISSAAATALGGKAAAVHTHVVGDLTAAGTRSSATFLRGDGAWAVPPGTAGADYNVIPMTPDAGVLTPDATLGSGPHRYTATSNITLASPNGGGNGQPLEVQVKASGAARVLTVAGAEVTIPDGMWWWGHFSYDSASDEWILDDSGGGGGATTIAAVTGLQGELDSLDTRVTALETLTGTTPGAPTAPTIGTVTATGPGQVTVAFTAPASNGGAAITGYTVTSSPGGITASGTASPIVVSGLTGGTSYTFTVTARNSVGVSSPSAASSAVTVVGVPGAPTIGTATAGAAGSGQVSVAFTAPASNGGSGITGYTATSSPGGVTGTGASSPITVSGLNPGTGYTFTVTATNALGTGPASAASNSVTPPVASGGTTGGIGGAGTGTVHTVPGGAVNVKTAHGAVGDGVADDGPAIRAAVAAVGAGGTVYFPNGTYKYVSTAPLSLNGVTLLGTGQTNAVILWHPPAWTPFAVSSGNNAGIKSLQIKRMTAVDVVQFPLQPHSGWTFDNVLLDGNRQIDNGVSDVYCMQLGVAGTLSNVKVLNSTIQNYQEFPLFQASNATGTTDGFEVRNCKFLNCWHTFLEFNAPSSVMKNIVVENNTFIGQYGPPAGGFGVGLANCKDSIVRYNYFEDIAQEPVHVEDRSDNIEVSYNRMVQGSKQHFSAGVQCVSGSTNVRIRSNVIDGTGAKDNLYIAAISALRGGSPMYPSGILIDDNTIDRGTNRGIFHECNGVTITNNRFTPTVGIENGGSLGTITVTNNTVSTTWPAAFPGGTGAPPPPGGGGGGTGTTPTITSVAGFTGAGAKTVTANAGDTLVAFVGSENSTPTISGAVEWGTRAAAVGTNYPHNISCFSGPVTTGGTQTITIGGSGTVTAVIYVLPGAVTANSVVTGGGSGPAAQAISDLAVTVDDALLLGTWGTQFAAADATANYTPPSGMAERVDSRPVGDYCVFASYSQVLGTAATISRTATASNAGLGWSGVLIALTS